MALLGWSLTSTVILLAILLFFIGAVFNRWLNDFGIPYNRWIAWPVGIILFTFLAYLWHPKPAFGLGILGLIVGGFLGGIFMGETPVED